VAVGVGAQRGSITAEFAVALPAVVLVLAMCLGCLQLGAQRLRLQDAAAVGARALARGDTVPPVPYAELSTWAEGPLRCVRLTIAQNPVIELSAESCALA
jgi:hypothetical protein